MQNKYGAHVVGGSRNGYGRFAGKLPGATVLGEMGGMDELPSGSSVIVRIFPDFPNADENAYGDFNQQTIDKQYEIGRYWLPKYMPQYQRIIDQYGDKLDLYFQVYNELGDSEDEEPVRKVAELHRGLIARANELGIKLAIFGTSGDSPPWELWVRHFVPVIELAGKHGHIYSRHAYSGVPKGLPTRWFDDAGRFTSDNIKRPFTEAKYLLERGINTGVVISELGWDGGFVAPDPDTFRRDLTLYAEQMDKYSNIWRADLWTWGDWKDKERSNLQDLSAVFTDWVGNKEPYRPTITTTPKPPPVDPPPAGGKHKAIVFAIPQPKNFSESDYLAAVKFARPLGRTITASHDDMRTLLLGGNSSSEVEIVRPDLPKQREKIALVKQLGYKWRDVTGKVFKKSPPKPIGGGSKSPTKPNKPKIDLLPYFIAEHNRQYMVESTDGAERYRYSVEYKGNDSGTFTIHKNNLIERYHWDANFIYQDVDTSPRWNYSYTVRGVNNYSLIVRCPRHMHEEQVWINNITHWVQEFYHGKDWKQCQRIPRGTTGTSTGPATNRAELIKVGVPWKGPDGLEVANTIHMRFGWNEGSEAEVMALPTRYGRLGWDGLGKTAHATSEDVQHQERMQPFDVCSMHIKGVL